MIEACNSPFLAGCMQINLNMFALFDDLQSGLERHRLLASLQNIGKDIQCHQISFTSTILRSWIRYVLLKISAIAVPVEQVINDPRL